MHSVGEEYLRTGLYHLYLPIDLSYLISVSLSFTLTLIPGTSLIPVVSSPSERSIDPAEYETKDKHLVSREDNPFPIQTIEDYILIAYY